jgi:hypothetical protein
MSVILTAGDRLEARFYCQDDEQGSVNTVFFKVIAVTGTVTDADAAFQFDNQIGAEIIPFITSNANYQGVACRVANRLPLPVAALANGAAGPGTASGTPLPRQSAGLLDFRTDLAGPGGRGRWFMPFPSNVQNESPGKPTAAYTSALSAFGALLLGLVEIDALVGGGSADVAFVLWSRTHAIMRPFTAAFGSTRWATLRSRGSFGRPNSGPF